MSTGHNFVRPTEDCHSWQHRYRVHLRGLSLENGSFAGHFHRLGGPTDFHRYIYAGDLIHSKHEWRIRRQSEPAFLNFESVCASRELSDTVKAGIVRHVRITETLLL